MASLTEIQTPIIMSTVALTAFAIKASYACSSNASKEHTRGDRKVVQR